MLPLYSTQCSHCIRTCKELMYNVILRQAGKTLHAGVDLHVGHNDFSYECITQHAAYPAESLVGDLGGLLGNKQSSLM